VIVNSLDNDDKHRLLRTAFVYTQAERGVDLIEVLEPWRLVGTPRNHWIAGQPLEDGTPLASYPFRDKGGQPLRSRPDVGLGFAVGELDAPRVRFLDMVERVREVVDAAARLLDAYGP
jgi:hypothetical protein